MLKIKRLTVNGIDNGTVTDEVNPRFAFSLISDVAGVSLDSAEFTLSNGWKKQVNDETGTRYDGEPLKPYSEYELKVFVKSTKGETAESSTFFKTAKLGEGFFGKWITDGSYVFKEKKVSPKVMTFNKKLTVDKEIKKAVIYSTALGIYNLFINGERVGKDYFAPGFTSYKKNLQYQFYDITSKLKKENEITVNVAGGWAVGKFTYCKRNRIYANRQAFLADIRVEYTDGTVEIFGTDESWRVTEDLKYLAADFYDGEVFDARITEKDVSFKSATVEKVKINPKMQVTYGILPTLSEEFSPINVFKAKNGETVYDFGQNFAGVVSIKANVESGRKIKIRHAEIMMNGDLFVQPLRSAKQTIEYISDGKSEEYTPEFTYMGFRYVGVSGAESGEIIIKANALYSNLERTGDFTCSDERLNKLQQNIIWSTKSNFIDIPIDCPQRDERMGWTGDIALFSRTASYNFDTSNFYAKWLKDLRADQKKGGAVPIIIPYVMFPSNLESVFIMPVDHWGDACILVPWAEYLARGDVNVLKDNYDAMKKYLKACKFFAGLFSVGGHRRIWSLGHHYGDWCAPGIGLFGWMGRGKWTATACFYNSLNIVSKIAEILGNKSDAEYYTKLKEETGRAYEKYFTDGKGKLKKEFQTGYVLPLYYGVFKKENKLRGAANLKALVENNNYNIGTGFPGTPYILFALSDGGQADAAYKMLLNEGCPSWLHQVKAGATTIWERWDALRDDGTSNTGESDGTHGMISFNHYANGAVGDFLYRRTLGIEAVTGGYKEFSVKPVLGGGITFAEGYVETPYGRIEVKWKIEKDVFRISVSVPVSAHGKVTLPNGDEFDVSSGKHEFDCKIEKSL